MLIFRNSIHMSKQEQMKKGVVRWRRQWLRRRCITVARALEVKKYSGTRSRWAHASRTSRMQARYSAHPSSSVTSAGLKSVTWVDEGAESGRSVKRVGAKQVHVCYEFR